MLDVAQLAEPLDVTQEGAGSKPVVHPNMGTETGLGYGVGPRHVVLDLYGGGGGCNPPVLWPAGFDSLTLHHFMHS